MAETNPDVLAVLRDMRAQLKPGSQDPVTFLRKDNPLAMRADGAIAAVAELIARDTEYDAALEALADLNRNIAERGWIDLEHDALRKACERVSRAKIDRAVALRHVQGGAA